MRFLLVLASTAIGCGGPLLEPGIYDVTTIQVEDTCGYRQSDLNHPIWYIDYVEQYYGVQNVNGTTISGEIVGEKIVFAKTEHEEDSECRYTLQTDMFLEPDGGDYFTGELQLGVSVDCAPDTCKLIYVVEGTLRKDEEPNYHSPFDNYGN